MKGFMATAAMVVLLAISGCTTMVSADKGVVKSVVPKTYIGDDAQYMESLVYVMEEKTDLTILTADDFDIIVSFAANPYGRGEEKEARTVSAQIVDFAVTDSEVVISISPIKYSLVTDIVVDSTIDNFDSSMEDFTVETRTIDDFKKALLLQVKVLKLHIG